MEMREAGLLERPRGGHRGERVLAAKGRVRTLVIRAEDEGLTQQGSVGGKDRSDGAGPPRLAPAVRGGMVILV